MDISCVMVAVLILCFSGTMPVTAQVRVPQALPVTRVIVPGHISPVANFTADVVAGPATLTVRFTDTSLNNPDSWLWDLAGDGLPDDQTQNPRYT